MKSRLFCILTVLALILSACAVSGEEAPMTSPAPSNAVSVQLPDRLTQGNGGAPSLKVYVVEDKKIESMDIETYVQGVLAGEMKNDWPMEALRAQAILARTFVLKFVSEKMSKYEGADVSTDIEEAQAYQKQEVNDRIREAVKSTEGLVLAQPDGQLPYAWFHAHSGGMTALAKEGLAYEKDEPDYTRVTEGQDSDKAPEDAKTWAATFTKKAFMAALKENGTEVSDLTAVAIGQRGESGRAVTLMINNDKEVSAPALRISLDSTKMRSTLLTSLQLKGDSVQMAGKGYGHGVGMPQWGAYGLAEKGKKGEEIVLTYFKNVSIARAW